MTTDFRIHDLQLALKPGAGKPPFTAVVQTLRAELPPEGLDTIVREGLRAAAPKLPMDVEIRETRLVPGGLQISARAKRSLLKADLVATVHISSPDGKVIRVRLAQMDAPVWVPVKLVVDQAIQMAAARFGLRPVAGDDRAVDLDPVLLMRTAGVPMTFDDLGVWSVDATAAGLSMIFAAM